jgi:hypothetical protein
VTAFLSDSFLGDFFGTTRKLTAERHNRKPRMIWRPAIPNGYLSRKRRRAVQQIMTGISCFAAWPAAGIQKNEAHPPVQEMRFLDHRDRACTILLLTYRACTISRLIVA